MDVGSIWFAMRNLFLYTHNTNLDGKFNAPQLGKSFHYNVINR